jgi:hypothetical protein
MIGWNGGGFCLVDKCEWLGWWVEGEGRGKNRC